MNNNKNGYKVDDASKAVVKRTLKKVMKEVEESLLLLKENSIAYYILRNVLDNNKMLYKSVFPGE